VGNDGAGCGASCTERKIMEASGGGGVPTPGWLIAASPLICIGTSSAEVLLIDTTMRNRRLIMRMSSIPRFVVVALAAGSLTLGCATKTQTGAAVGAAGGAVIGAVTGVGGGTAQGAIIGAAVGGAAGAIIGSIMDKQAKELEQNIQGATVERVGEGIKVTFQSGLLFAFDSDVVLPEARANLTELARSLDKYPETDLLIVGHTDNVGTDAYNLGLSERRAEAAASYLRFRGVSQGRLRTSGRGELEPVSSNDTEQGRSLNRRVEVAIYASDKMQEAARRQATQGS